MSQEAERRTRSKGRLTRHAGSLLSLIIVLRRSRDLDSFKDLRRTVDRLFQDFRLQARDAGVASDEIADACYALGASFDEVLLSAQWAGKEEWQRDSMAKAYCNNEFVGDGFFDKLTEVRRSVSPKPEVLEVFYYCLISGFQGRMIESPQQRTELIEELSREIGGGSKALAPNGLPVPEGGKLEPIRRFPWPVVVIVSVCIPILLWLLFWDALDGHADAILQNLRGI